MKISRYIFIVTTLASALTALGDEPRLPANPAQLTADSLSTTFWQSKLPEPPATDDTRWWSRLGDPVLDSLIALADEHNYDVLAAARRVEIARQGLNLARAAYWPTIGVSAGYTRERTSGAMASPRTPANTLSYLSLGLDMSWQIDIFGKITSRARQSKELFRAGKAEFDAAVLTVRATVASAYIQLRLLQAELQVAQAHLESQDTVFKMATARYEAGLGSKLEVAQAATVYYSTAATVPGLRGSIEQTVNSLNVLVGEIPGSLDRALSAPAPLPDHHALVGNMIPMDLLTRRPDIAAAQAQVAAAAEGLGIARKDYLPTLSLEGSVGTSAHRAGDLFSNRSFTYAIAPKLSWTLFDGFSRRYAVAEARERMQAEIDSYNLTVLNAVADVNNATSAYNTSLAEIDSFNRVVEQSREAVSLSVDLYRGGLTSFTNVADAQINYLSSTNSWLEARAKALSALITLYEALGGGWDVALLN